MTLSKPKTLVVGLGATGRSLMGFLHNQGVEVAGYDANMPDDTCTALAQEFPHCYFYSGDLAHVLAENAFERLALSPGISRRRPEIARFAAAGGEVVGDVEIFARLVRPTASKVIAITGSNGKSTVTSLVGFLCEACGLDTVVAGNIGLPVLEAWQERARAGKTPDVWVLELSSFQLDTTDSLEVDAAAVLNISEDHLDRYDNLLDYAHSKDHIFAHAKVQVLNADDALCRAMRRPNQECRRFSLAAPADYWVQRHPETQLMAADAPLLPVRELPLAGLHNAANVLASLALCEGIGLTRSALLEALPRFRGLPHRVEKVGEINGVIFIDDSKGTNVGATAAALAGTDAPVLLIAGGLGKGQNFAPLAQAARDKVKRTFLIGRDADAIAAAFAHENLPTEHCGSLPEAVQKAFQAASAGDWVLLSPACASMDMFRDYAHRAEVFVESVENLAPKGGC